MNQLARKSLAIATFLVAACGSGASKPLPITKRAGAIQLRNGTNPTDLLGNGTESQVIVAWRGNYNAHGFSTATFLVHATSDLGDSTGIWQIVPFLGGPNDGATGREQFTTMEGADCTLRDIRVVMLDTMPVSVTIATRDFGASFADSAPVRFDRYILTRNNEGMVGLPPFYFAHAGFEMAKRWYCDVNQALAVERQLGSGGLGRAEGGR